eukprot:TRINITY_DN3329_c0_g1_i2.p2 TRINITY_DN3329_c0_g1~~TRINITY_DN3329_c0_g1_i2.p2  ORF type:complete len:108 (+),score=19.50 TRINITY_DN3329_c0_g1_i2:142-465(+)
MSIGAVVFDLDACCWDPEMYQLWGGGAPFTQNKDNTLTDCSGATVRLLGAVPEVWHELHTDPKWADTALCVASRCDEPLWGRECLRKFQVSSEGPSMMECILSLIHI